MLNFGIPVARFPKPPQDPHIKSDTLSPSSSTIALARLISERALFVSNRWTKEFIGVVVGIKTEEGLDNRGLKSERDASLHPILTLATPLDSLPPEYSEPQIVCNGRGYHITFCAIYFRGRGDKGGFQAQNNDRQRATKDARISQDLKQSI